MLDITKHFCAACDGTVGGKEARVWQTKVKLQSAVLPAASMLPKHLPAPAAMRYHNAEKPVLFDSCYQIRSHTLMVKNGSCKGLLRASTEPPCHKLVRLSLNFYS